MKINCIARLQITKFLSLNILHLHCLVFVAIVPTTIMHRELLDLFTVEFHCM